jgi:transposase
MNDSKVVVRLGIDLGKNVFHLWGVNADGERVLKRKLSRVALRRELANREPCLIGMEACGSAHYWARELTALGHEVRLMAPQYVKPYVKGNKNDYNDAEAICEAVSRPGMRFVTVKSVDQQQMQSLHRIRQGEVKSQTSLVNRIRGLLAEYGLVVTKGVAQLRVTLPQILEDGDNGLPDRFRGWLSQLYEQLLESIERVKSYTQELQQMGRANDACQRLEAVEGIGPISASALVATVGDGSQFPTSRHFAASLGLVPRQHSTGDRTVLLGISKRGDGYLRTLLVHGARSVIHAALRRDKTDRRSLWIKSVVARRGKNIAAVALANKNARIVWALLVRGERYRSGVQA